MLMSRDAAKRQIKDLGAIAGDDGDIEGQHRQVLAMVPGRGRDPGQIRPSCQRIVLPAIPWRGDLSVERVATGKAPTPDADRPRKGRLFPRGFIRWASFFCYSLSS